MFSAKEMRNIAEQARIEKKINDKCVAQHFFSNNLNKIKDAAKEGETDILLAVTGTDRESIKEILRLYRNFGYGAFFYREGLFSCIIEIKW